ncbi:hypothetical protein RN629_09355 [Sphingomonadaceae bacterium jetA1]|uniref:hypothetical protein n=1 Tax=Facivitalis istanbulensis TaxID=3075838 RepID=UPI0034820489
MIVLAWFAMMSGEAGTAPAPRAFDDMARRAEAMCPARHAATITPGDLDSVQSAFRQSLSPALRHRLGAVNRAGPRCTHQNGLSCPTNETLLAYQRLQWMPRFVAYLCTHPNPVTVSHPVSHL